MARVELASEVGDDFDRIFDRLAEHDFEHVAVRVGESIEALNALETKPEIGYQAPGDKRELVIGGGSRSYVALRHYMPELDTAFVLAIRSQREAGYRRI